MTPAQIIALIRDALIVGGIGYILWFIHHADQNAAKVADLAAVTKQMDAIAVTQARWQKEAQDADTKRNADNAQILSAVNSHTAPIIVRVPASGSPVSGHPASSSGNTACTGGSDKGSGEDIRPAIQAFELKYEGYFSQCRSVLASWPK